MEGMKLKHTFFILCFLSFAFDLINSAKPREYHQLALGPDERGPESIAFDCNGKGPYVGISDGRILKWNGEDIGWSVFAVTTANRSSLCDGVFNSPMELSCGRPLGLKFNKATCELYIADSSFGLMKVGCEGGVATLLANSAEDIPFHFLNGLDVDSHSGVVYFTDSSSHYHRWEFLQVVITGERSGRLMKYDPKSQKVTVLLRNLSFANGVALSKKKDFVLVVETTLSRVLKFWLTGPNSGTWEVFFQLVGIPDNINRNNQGDFWIAGRNATSVKVNELGEVLEILNNDEVLNPSDVTEFHNDLWIGYFDQPYLTWSFNWMLELQIPVNFQFP